MFALSTTFSSGYVYVRTRWTDSIGDFNVTIITVLFLKECQKP